MRYSKKLQIRVTEEQYNFVKTNQLNISEYIRKYIDSESKKKSVTTMSVQCHDNYIDQLDLIYQKYPRKEGKSAGYKRLGQLDDWGLECLELAIENYNAHIKKNRIEPKYIKMFSTFVSEWKDWVTSPGEVNNGSDESSFL